MELKHIAPYLPYGLKIIVDIYGQKSEIGLLYGANEKQLELAEIRETITESFNYEFCKPILRNLSDLTKPIEHNGERFVAGNKIDSIITDVIDDFVYVKYDGPTHVLDLSYKTIQKLLEWKFDVFNLIGTFAIDANNLETNPYK